MEGKRDKHRRRGRRRYRRGWRFSARTPGGLRANRLAEEVRVKEASGTRVADWTVSNPTKVGLAYPDEVIRRALSDESAMRYGPEPLGLEAARQAVAEHYRSRPQAEVEARDVILTSSTSEAYSLVFKLMMNASEEVLVPQPGYPLIEHLARGEGVRGIFYPYGFDGSWTPDVGAVEQSIARRTRMLAVVHPNNPTGAYLKEAEWQALREVALRYRLVTVCDEVFFEFPLQAENWQDLPEPIFHPLAEREAPLFLLGGLSKCAGLPQLKLGWIILRGPAEFKHEARRRLEFLCDHYLSVGTPVQVAAPRLLQSAKEVGDQIRSRVRSNDRLIRKELSDSPATPLPAEGGWYAVIRLPSTKSEEEWALELLRRQDVLTHPGYFYDFPSGCQIVVSLLVPESDTQRGLQGLKELLKHRA
ncbi:MAG TPA: pyridoxal phosphate-dependent aminotransferase [Acidobacteriota bacterium]|nr:pyridoxal phosphate-dependent aminotransferase [Acidobacteriota bacterium]